MAVTNRGTKWEIKNTINFISLLFPVVDAMPFFQISRRVDDEKLRKRWVKMGTIIIIIGAILSVLFVLSGQNVFGGMMPSTPEYTVTGLERPDEKDYLGYDYEERYDGDEYRNTKEYSQFEKDLGKYMHSKEFTTVQHNKDNFIAKMLVIEVLLITSYFLWVVLVFVIGMNERTRYLRWLANKANMADAAAELQNKNFDLAGVASTVKNAVQDGVQQIKSNVAPQPPVQQTAPVPTPPQPVQLVAEPEFWVCTCGNQNQGRFCGKCGQPKPIQQTTPEPKQDNSSSPRRMLDL